MAGTLTWLGHASFRIDSPGGKRIYVDPFLNGNPKCPEDELEPERVDLIAITHGHEDHVGDTIALYEKFKCRVIAQVELRDHLAGQGVGDWDGADPSKGGTVDEDGIRITFTDANHSSSHGGTYTGEPCGLVIALEDDTRVYFAGDTNVFGDMALIARLYKPTRRGAPDRRPLHHGPERGGRRARAARRRAVRAVPLRHVPDPQGHARRAARARACRRRDRRLRARRLDRPLIAASVRERWLGATGRRVPEIAVEGELELPGAHARARRARPPGDAEAFDEGRPVAVRADTAETVRAALARPEVSCVARPGGSKRQLLELDLPALTYD